MQRARRTARPRASLAIILGVILLVVVASVALALPSESRADMLHLDGRLGRWVWQRPLPQGEDIRDLRFADALHGWAVTDIALLRTTNGGRSWSELPGAASLSPRRAAFADAMTGWIAGVDEDGQGTISITTDGGLTWTTQLTTTTPEDLSDITCTDAMHVWAVGATSDCVYRTTDGGATWTKVALPETAVSFAISFADGANGCAVASDGTMLYSSDGGREWHVSRVLSVHLSDVFMADALNAWAVGANGAIFHSDDGGENWDSLDSGTAADLTSVGSSASQGWITGRGGVILASPNGHEWSAQASPTADDLSSLAVVGPSLAWCGGSDGVILRTTTPDGPWAAQAGGAEPDLNDVCVLMLSDAAFEGDAWAVGKDGRILHTTNGGALWVEQHRGGNTLNAVSFCDQEHGWAVGMFGNVYGTSDSGRHWTLEGLGLAAHLYDVEASSPSMALAVGSGGRIFRFDGESWTQRPSGVTADLFGIAISGAKSYAVGDAGTVLRSDDGGLTWSKQTLPAPPAGLTQRINDVDFVDDWTGWCVGDDGLAYRTHDGGLHWLARSAPAGCRFSSVRMLRRWGWAAWHYHVFLGCSGGVGSGLVHHLDEDDGTWTSDDLQGGLLGVTGIDGTGGYLNEIGAYAPMRVWAVGGDGMIVSSEEADKTGPVTSHDAPSGWRTTDVTVSLTPTDTGSGVWVTQFRLGAKGWQYGTSTTFAAPSNHTGDGVHTMRFFSVDKMGHEEAERTAEVKIDTMKPFSWDDGDLLWCRAKTIHFSAEDPPGVEGAQPSGVAAIRYSLDGAPWAIADSITLKAGKRDYNNGGHSIAYYATDAAGNLETYHWCHIKLDGVAPTTSDNAPDDVAIGGFTLELTPWDRFSGVEHTYYSVDGGEWQEGTSAFFLGFLTPVTRTVAYYSVDRAGNRESIKTCTFTVWRPFLPLGKARARGV